MESAERIGIVLEGIVHPDTHVSKVAYHKQHMKLNPEAIKFLYQHHNKNYYQDPEETPRLYAGYLAVQPTAGERPLLS